MSDEPLVPDAAPAPPQPAAPAAPEPAPPQPAPGPPETPRRDRAWLVPVIVVSAVVLLCCCAGTIGTSGYFLIRNQFGFTITGDQTLTGEGIGADGTPCQGTGGYADINEGTPVVVSKVSKTLETIATGELRAGRTRAGNCVFPFTVRHVPKYGSYAVAISHRGVLIFTRHELKRPIHLVLG